MSLHSILVKSIRVFVDNKADAAKALHSILVKSIPEKDISQQQAYKLYIPFWLNLYPFARERDLSTI